MLKDRLFPVPTANRLLWRLPECDYQRMLPHLQPVALDVERTLYDGDGPLDHAYFPTYGVVSALAITSDGSAIEVASIGKEGVVAPLNFPTGLPCRLVVQVAGTALRIEVSALLWAHKTPSFFDVSNDNWDMTFDPNGASLEPFRSKPAASTG